MQKQSCWKLMLACCRTLCWAGDTLGIPRCHRCAAQPAASSAPELCQQVLASHTSPGMAVLLLMVMLCCQLGASRNYSPQPGARDLLHPAARSSMGSSSSPATVGQGALTSCLLPGAAHTIWEQPVPGWEPCKPQVLCEGLAEPT